MKKSYAMKWVKALESGKYKMEGHLYGRNENVSWESLFKPAEKARNRIREIFEIKE